jgi:hypothetical protein
MAFVLGNRVKESCTAPGTGTVTLLGAATGYQTFSSGIGANNTTYYVIADQTGANWEVGFGTLGSGGTTLARTTVYASSNSGSLVNFSSGTQDVFCDYPANRSVEQSDVGTSPNQIPLNQYLGTMAFQDQAGVNIIGGTATLSGVTVNGSTVPTNGVYLPAANTVGIATASTARLQIGATGGVSIGNTTDPGATNLSVTGTSASGSDGIHGNASTTYVTVKGDTSYPGIYATGGTNTPLVLQPLGTGALQAQKTDSTATGGNARGANAVDWQTVRETASKVASSNNSAILGGYGNGVSGGYASIGGGYRNIINSFPNGSQSFIGAGETNTITGYDSAIVTGAANLAYGQFAFIGGGQTNQANPSASITTGITTLATTAGTTINVNSANANIKVGQLITGTGFVNSPPYTYATSAVVTGTTAGNTAFTSTGSSISGTTLTIGTVTAGTVAAGQVLTGTGVTAGTYIVSNISGSGSGSTWTVSASQTVASTAITGTGYTFTVSQNTTVAQGITMTFYSPHAIVVGGGNNQATGAYSFIGGGGDGGTATNRNTASGDWSFVGGGRGNTASGIASFIGGGGTSGTSSAVGNTASGANSTIGGGYSNVASGTGSSVLGGLYNQATGNFSTVLGATDGFTRGIIGNFVFGIGNTSINYGQAQSGLLVLQAQTTDATATVLVSNTTVAGTTNQVILPNNSAYYFKGFLVAGVTGAGNSKGWEISGVIKRGANAASTVMVGTPTVTSSYADSGASTWTVTATADTTNGGLAVTVTGAAATTIRWVCKVETTEMTF